MLLRLEDLNLSSKLELKKIALLRPTTHLIDKNDSHIFSIGKFLECVLNLTDFHILKGQHNMLFALAKTIFFYSSHSMQR